MEKRRGGKKLQTSHYEPIDGMLTRKDIITAYTSVMSLRTVRISPYVASMMLDEKVQYWFKQADRFRISKDRDGHESALLYFTSTEEAITACSQLQLFLTKPSPVSHRLFPYKYVEEVEAHSFLSKQETEGPEFAIENMWGGFPWRYFCNHLVLVEDLSERVGSEDLPAVFPEAIDSFTIDHLPKCKGMALLVFQTENDAVSFVDNMNDEILYIDDQEVKLTYYREYMSMGRESKHDPMRIKKIAVDRCTQILEDADRVSLHNKVKDLTQELHYLDLRKLPDDIVQMAQYVEQRVKAEGELGLSRRQLERDTWLRIRSWQRALPEPPEDSNCGSLVLCYESELEDTRKQHDQLSAEIIDSRVQQHMLKSQVDKVREKFLEQEAAHHDVIDCTQDLIGDDVITLDSEEEDRMSVREEEVEQAVPVKKEIKEGEQSPQHIVNPQVVPTLKPTSDKSQVNMKYITEHIGEDYVSDIVNERVLFISQLPYIIGDKKVTSMLTERCSKYGSVKRVTPFAMKAFVTMTTTESAIRAAAGLHKTQFLPENLRHIIITKVATLRLYQDVLEVACRQHEKDRQQCLYLSNLPRFQPLETFKEKMAKIRQVLSRFGTVVKIRAWEKAVIVKMSDAADAARAVKELKGTAFYPGSDCTDIIITIRGEKHTATDSNKTTFPHKNKKSTSYNQTKRGREDSMKKPIFEDPASKKRRVGGAVEKRQQQNKTSNPYSRSGERRPNPFSGNRKQPTVHKPLPTSHHISQQHQDRRVVVPSQNSQKPLSLMGLPCQPHQQGFSRQSINQQQPYGGRFHNPQMWNSFGNNERNEFMGLQRITHNPAVQTFQALNCSHIQQDSDAVKWQKLLQESNSASSRPQQRQLSFTARQRSFFMNKYS